MNSVTFLFDRNVPEQLVRMLSHFDRTSSFLFLDDKFERATADATWLTEAPARPTIYSIPISGTKIDFFCLTQDLGKKRPRSS